MRDRIENFILGWIVITCAHLYVYAFCWRYGHWITQTLLNPRSETATHKMVLFCEGVAWLLFCSAICEVILRRYSAVLTEKRWLALGCMSMLGTAHLLAVWYYPNRQFAFEFSEVMATVSIMLFAAIYLVRFQLLYMKEKTGFDLLLGLAFFYPWSIKLVWGAYVQFNAPPAQPGEWAEWIARYIIPLCLALPTLFPVQKMNWAVVLSMVSNILLVLALTNRELMQWLIYGAGLPLKIVRSLFITGSILIALSMLVALPGRIFKLVMAGVLSVKKRIQESRGV